MPFSTRLHQAIHVGMVIINHDEHSAIIASPPHPELLTDDDWLIIITAASEMITELENLGYSVKG